EHVVQDVAQIRHSVGIEASAGRAGYALVSVAVVGGALLWIAQDAISFGRFLEFLLGMFIARIAVGMMRQGELAVGRLEHRFIAVPDYTEDFIIVSFGHAHWLIS